MKVDRRALVRVGGSCRGTPRTTPESGRVRLKVRARPRLHCYGQPRGLADGAGPGDARREWRLESRSAGEAGLFGPGSLTWRVNSEMVLLAGGGRALLLQVGHPLVAAGVAQHSGYEEDPWGRLFRTLDLTTRIVFGDAGDSAAASRRLDRVHSTVTGLADDGTPYEARSPTCCCGCGRPSSRPRCSSTRYVHPLTAAELNAYYVEQTRFAAACGVPEGHWPRGYAEFAEWFDGVVHRELRVTEPLATSLAPPYAPPSVFPLVRPSRR